MFLCGFYFFFIGYQNIFIEKNTDLNFTTQSGSKQKSKAIKDIHLQKNQEETIIINNLKKVNVIENINNLDFSCYKHVNDISKTMREVFNQNFVT